MKTILVLLLLCATAYADDVYGGVAMDTAPLVKARYEHRVLMAELSLPVIRPSGGDGELRAGARHTFQLSPRWRIDGTLAGFIRGTNNDAFRAGSVGIDIEVIPTVTVGRATFGLELGVDQSGGTYIANHEATREVYMDVQDGWYRATQTTFRAGLRAAYPVGAGEIRLRAGAANGLLIPYFTELGFTLHL